MSNKPNPVAMTASLICERYHYLREFGDKGPRGWSYGALESATLASIVHRIAPACQRHAIAQCNGEWRDGQRDYFYKMEREGDKAGCRKGLDALAQSIEDYGQRLEKRIAKINARLAPFKLEVWAGGDPRGCVCRLQTTDSKHTFPCPDGSTDQAHNIA